MRFGFALGEVDRLVFARWPQAEPVFVGDAMAAGRDAFSFSSLRVAQADALLTGKGRATRVNVRKLHDIYAVSYRGERVVGD